MARSPILLISATVALLSIAAASDVPQIAHPIAQLLAKEELYTTLRTAFAPYKRRAVFSGGVKGVCVKLGGTAKYAGTFEGFSTPLKTRVSFKVGMKGFLNTMGLSGNYKSGAQGTLVLVSKGPLAGAKVDAQYGVVFYGRAHGKKVYLKSGAKVVATFSKRGVYVKEFGQLYGSVGQKKVSAKYVGTFDGKVFTFRIRGLYAGKKFYFNYEGSFEGIENLDFNPMMVKRNYGVVYGKVNGKTFRHKYDFKGMPKLA